MEWKKVSNKVLSYFMEHKSNIDCGMRSINVMQYVAKKQYIEAVKSGIDLISSIGQGYYHASDFLNIHNGWEKLFDSSEGRIADLFDLDKYPFRSFQLQGNSVVSIYTLPNGAELAVIVGHYEWEKQRYIYYNKNFFKREQLIGLLSQDLFDTLNSQCMVLCDDGLDKRKTSISIKPYVLEAMSSSISSQLEKYLTKSIAHNLSRSVMLYSEPGTGKSMIATNTLYNLNLKTLKIDNFSKVSTDFVKLLIDIFKIEAILIDDLDHMHVSNNSMILDFLEKIRKQVKVIIATVNSTKKFHKALLRPGRFDKIIYVKSLDEEVVQKVLGDDLMIHFERVKDWPIAFINELALNSRLENNVGIDIMIDDLQKRVGSNSEDTIDLNDKAAETKVESKEEKTAA